MPPAPRETEAAAAVWPCGDVGQGRPTNPGPASTGVYSGPTRLCHTAYTQSVSGGVEFLSRVRRRRRATADD